MTKSKPRRRRITSTFVKSTIGVGSGSTFAGMQPRKVHLGQIREQRIEAEHAKESQIRALTSATYRNNDADSDIDMGFEHDLEMSDSAYAPGFIDSDDDTDEEEHVRQQTESNRDGTAIQEARQEIFASFYHKIGAPAARRMRRNDRRIWRQRNDSTHASWTAQMPDLVNAYLEWRYGSPTDERSNQQPDPETGSQEGHNQWPLSEDGFFEVTAVDIKDHVNYRKIPQYPDERANVALIRAGFLGSAPIDPSVAISLDSLELYHQIRRRQSSFSLQAMAKVLCALHNVTYFPTFRNQLSAAFDMYLDIHRRIQQLINHELARDTPNWRMLNACPPCSYKLDGEPILSPARLQSMDGNNSLKRFDGAGHTDTRQFFSDYSITPAEVDVFKDDVRSRPGTRVPGSMITQNEVVENDEPPPHANEQTPCTDNWVAANAVSKDTLQLFEQTGIFVSVCRHGLIQTLVEMRRSGELAKYGLATLNRIIDTYGARQCMGYDIACSHVSTVAASSIGAKARNQGLTLAVNAFHRHAHNMLCQLRNHPLYLNGLGLEDLETCERVFSASNAVARVVRHSSYFHWQQYIDLHYRQWDEGKYLELSKFLHNNYQQALAVIREYTPEVEHFKASLSLEDADFHRWQTEQITYLTNLKDEPEVDTLKVEYVQALEQLMKSEAVYGAVTTVQFQGYTPADFASGGDLSVSSQTRDRLRETERRSAHRRLLLAMNVADSLKRTLGIPDRWTPADNEYKTAVEYIRHRKFIRVVETLEQLVVQRLLELAKANLAETGYKMRKHIGRAIARRSGAVRTALDKYNALAPLQDPPRPILDYSTVASYGWLGEFELLKESRHEILEKPWANARNREISTKYFKILRAHEEITRLNVEIQRLRTWVDDEDAHYLARARSLAENSPQLAVAIRHEHAKCTRVNEVHRQRLRCTYTILGYCGERPGHEEGTLMPAGEVSGGRTAGLDEMVARDLWGEEPVNIDEDDAIQDESLRYELAITSAIFV